jgi:alpha(1,3/1,4) fucosyltransferase
MKEKLKIKFVDFWVNYNKLEENYFCELLSNKYELEFSDDPEIIFYSNFGSEHLKYKCIRIFFSTENIRPDYRVCDFSIGFDYKDQPRHFRLPLWVFYYIGHVRKNELLKLDNLANANMILENWKRKTKFCCFIVSNPTSEKRNNFFHTLNKVKRVDSAGNYLNNIGYTLEGGTYNKLEFIRDYRFVISFENSAFPGYTTEKILEPLLVGSIPIYWGDPLIQNEFNPKRFINYSSFRNEEDLINRILEIDNNPDLAMELLKEKSFSEGLESLENLQNRFSDFLMEIVGALDKITPVARHTLKSGLYNMEKYIAHGISRLKNRVRQIVK